MTTIATLVDYVIANRRGKAFVDWTPIEIAEAFLAGAKENLLIYAEKDGQIHGVAHGMRIGRIIFVSNILTTQPGILRRIMTRFREMHPGIELEAERRSRLHKYNTTKLANKLSSKE